ncbi:twin-arginine translocase subunit TatC [Coriobacteriia bacterium Es71-Z0120]|uniref:twin-arginine translocase subunit TatC n=1 Tax=Parvivirga hydrogeniphila TaxID=2939460 RepID=UPI002260BC86|nr:twin-arginine translocase subunit TatC [Parvivirga hydrogeniphila]MCL4079309.1 twin-arginine translocase subunit TatC [Parvivirga hydrogeniphila]
MATPAHAMPISPKRMPFMSHLAELRNRLTVVVVVLGVTALAGYFFATPIYKFLVAPLQPVLQGKPAVTLKLLEAMGIRFKLGVWGALVVSSPVIIYEALAFFLPALKPKERVWFIWTFIAAVALFLAGAAFCYFVVLDPSAQWLAKQNGDIFSYLPTGADLVTLAMYFILGFGVAFEVPVLVFYLVYFGVIPYDKLRKNWRVVWVVLATVAAMITPDWSPVTMGLLAIAMIGLFEGTMLLLRALLARKIRSQREAFALDEE